MSYLYVLPRDGGILEDVSAERVAQDRKWGEQHHPDGTGGEEARKVSDFSRALTDARAESGELTWRDILREEFDEAIAESEPRSLEEELVQVAAVAVAWIRDIRSRRRGR